MCGLKNDFEVVKLSTELSMAAPSQRTNFFESTLLMFPTTAHRKNIFTLVCNNFGATVLCGILARMLLGLQNYKCKISVLFKKVGDRIIIGGDHCKPVTESL